MGKVDQLLERLDVDDVDELDELVRLGRAARAGELTLRLECGHQLRVLPEDATLYCARCRSPRRRQTAAKPTRERSDSMS